MAMRECGRLLRQFADGHLPLGEFERRYWMARSRWLYVDGAVPQSRLDAVRGFEDDLSRYVADPLPQIQQVEERELRRRALKALRAIAAA